MLDALEDRGIEDGWRFAEPLAAVGLDADWVDRVQAIAGPATGKTLSWVAASLTAHELATELVESTERMSGLVKAIKTYAYMDRGGVVQADVHEGLESTLVMLGHKLKHTQIKVKRDYDKSLPQLMMYGSELNQVWTNLLDNAIGALGENGEITITTQPGQRLHQGRHRRRRPGHPGRGAHAHLRPVLHHQGPGQRHGHGPGHRAAHRRTAPLRLDLVRHRRRRHDLPRLAAPRWSEEMTQCTHLDTIEITELPAEVEGCEDCLTTGGVWLHLRICLHCGHVGCCDDSPNKHATAHASREHPIIRSLEPGEDWCWCFEDQVGMRIPQVTGSTRIPPSPMLSR